MAKEEATIGADSTILGDLDFNYTGTAKSNNLTGMTKALSTSIPKGKSMKKYQSKNSDQSNS